MNFLTPAPPGFPLSFVLDVSVAATWAIPPRYTVYTHRVQSRLAAGVAAVVATNWPLELVDELHEAACRGETTRQRIDRILAGLSSYRISVDPRAPTLAWPELMDLAGAHPISVRDAAYLELALRLSLPLATTDATLIRAAAAAGVPNFTP
jgi:predicted nucleic acid-binding protein